MNCFVNILAFYTSQHVHYLECWCHRPLEPLHVFVRDTMLQDVANCYCQKTCWVLTLYNNREWCKQLTLYKALELEVAKLVSHFPDHEVECNQQQHHYHRYVYLRCFRDTHPPGCDKSFMNEWKSMNLQILTFLVSTLAIWIQLLTSRLWFGPNLTA